MPRGKNAFGVGVLQAGEEGAEDPGLGERLERPVADAGELTLDLMGLFRLCLKRELEALFGVAVVLEPDRPCLAGQHLQRAVGGPAILVTQPVLASGTSWPRHLMMNANRARAKREG